MTSYAALSLQVSSVPELKGLAVRVHGYSQERASPSPGLLESAVSVVSRLF